MFCLIFTGSESLYHLTTGEIIIIAKFHRFTWKHLMMMKFFQSLSQIRKTSLVHRKGMFQWFPSMLKCCCFTLFIAIAICCYIVWKKYSFLIFISTVPTPIPPGEFSLWTSFNARFNYYTVNSHSNCLKGTHWFFLNEILLELLKSKNIFALYISKSGSQLFSRCVS